MSWSRMREAAEAILAGRKAAARFGKEFVVDREKLGRFGGFSTREMDSIEVACRLVEDTRERILLALDRDELERHLCDNPHLDPCCQLD